MTITCSGLGWPFKPDPKLSRDALIAATRKAVIEGITASAQGKIAAKVRVVDVATGQTRWPNTGESYPLHASTDYVRHNGADAAVAVRGQMLEQPPTNAAIHHPLARAAGRRRRPVLSD